MSFTDILGLESLEEGLSHFNILIENGVSNSDLSFIHKNGSVQWCNLNTVKLSETRFIGFTKDINQRKEMEEAIRLSQEKYHLLLENSGIGVGVYSLEGKILLFNQKALRHLGGKPSDYIGKSLDEVFGKDAGKVYLERIQASLKSDASLEFEDHVQLKTGNYWFLTSFTRVNGYDGKIMGIQVLAHDVTERKLAELKIREQYKFLNILLGTIPNPVFHKDLEGLYRGCNKAFEKFLDKSFDEIIGKTVFDISPKEVADEYFKKDAELYNNPGTQKYEWIVVGKDGKKHDVIFDKATLTDEEGKPTGIIGIITDITDGKQAEANLLKSEELFRSLVYNSSDLTLLTDAQGVVTFLSPQCESVIGYPAEKFIGELIPEIIHPDDMSRSQQAWKKVLEQGEPIHEFEYRVLDIEGSVRWLSHSATLIRIDNQVIGMQSTIRNITERKTAEQALRVSEEKYKTMLNASPDGIFLIDMKGIITEVSEIGLELLGTETKDDILGKNFLLFVPSDEKDTVRKISEKTMNEGLAQNVGIKVRKKNQSLFAAETSVTLIQGPDGAPLSYMIILRDISQRKKMETKQMHADRMANLGEMASGIAHEINQPLNIISMVMDKLLFESAKAATIDLEFFNNKSNKIFENITRIRNIIDHIRAFSRSHDDYVLTPFDINTSIVNAVSMITEQFKHLGIKLNLQLEKKIPQLLGNTYKFEQVVINLLSNSKDAVCEKKSKLENDFEMIIEIKSYSENQSLIVEITDNGIGISNEDINNIILPFYTTKEEGKGTGLGLSICYQIINEMNGTIDIKSDQMKGTKIKLVLDTLKNKVR